MLNLGNANDVLAWVGANGPQALGVIAFLCALGIPLPITLLMIASGALARHGLSNLGEAIAAAFIGSILAESLHYGLGASARPWLRGRLTGRLRRLWEQAEERFHRGPGITVFLSRFLLTPIGLPTNWIAGSSRYPYVRFLVWSFLGNAMWILSHAALGYWLGDGWQRYENRLDSYRGWIILIALVAILAYLLWRQEVARTLRESEQPSEVSAPPQRDRDPRWS